MKQGRKRPQICIKYNKRERDSLWILYTGYLLSLVKIKRQIEREKEKGKRGERERKERGKREERERKERGEREGRQRKENGKREERERENKRRKQNV